MLILRSAASIIEPPVGGWELIASVGLGGGSAVTGPTPGVDTTGANLIVEFAWTNSITGDSFGNTYSTPSSLQGYSFRYSVNPTVGPNHQWTTGGSYSTSAIMAFRGAAANPFAGATGSVNYWIIGYVVAVPEPGCMVAALAGQPWTDNSIMSPNDRGNPPATQAPMISTVFLPSGIGGGRAVAGAWAEVPAGWSQVGVGWLNADGGVGSGGTVHAVFKGA